MPSRPDAQSAAYVWPRTCCVYCGTRLTNRHKGREDSRLACRAHRSLLVSDPMYAADLGEDAQAREGAEVLAK